MVKVMVRFWGEAMHHGARSGTGRLVVPATGEVRLVLKRGVLPPTPAEDDVPPQVSPAGEE